MQARYILRHNMCINGWTDRAGFGTKIYPQQLGLSYIMYGVQVYPRARELPLWPYCKLCTDLVLFRVFRHIV